MPIKKDDEKRWVEMEFVAPGTPEQLWQAMATGPGNSAWFCNTEVHEGAGGTIRFDFGTDGSTTGDITDWEPPSKLTYIERNWMEGAPPVTTEITITARSGDQCVVRMVHSLFTSSADWDDQLESFEGGWPGFFEVLRVYLANFAGQPGKSTRVVARHSAGELYVWKKLLAALQLTGINADEPCSSPVAAPQFAGVVRRVHQDSKSRELMIQLSQPGDGILLLGSYLHGENARAIISLYFYGASAAQRVATAHREWESWLSQILSE